MLDFGGEQLMNTAGFNGGSGKCFGGLDFKDLVIFIQALLKKHVWRFLQRPNSLVSCVFKEKYYLSIPI